MSDIEVKPTPPPADIVASELEARYPELLPGAAQRLGAVWSSLGTAPADVRAAELEKRMQGGLADRFKNPEYKPPTLEDGGTPSTLRQVLTRNAARLAPGAVNKLVPILAMKTNGKPSHEVAATVERFLGSREAHPFLAVQPKPRAADGRFAEPPTSNRPSRPIKTNF